MALFDTTFYWSAIVNIALFCTVFDLFDVDHWLMPVSCHFRDCKSAAGHESDSCKRRYNKCPDLYLYL